MSCVKSVFNIANNSHFCYCCKPVTGWIVDRYCFQPYVQAFQLASVVSTCRFAPVVYRIRLQSQELPPSPVWRGCIWRLLRPSGYRLRTILRLKCRKWLRFSSSRFPRTLWTRCRRKPRLRLPWHRYRLNARSHPSRNPRSRHLLNPKWYPSPKSLLSLNQKPFPSLSHCQNLFPSRKWLLLNLSPNQSQNQSQNRNQSLNPRPSRNPNHSPHPPPRRHQQSLLRPPLPGRPALRRRLQRLQPRPTQTHRVSSARWITPAVARCRSTRALPCVVVRRAVFWYAY